jgi:hypothetical protein
MRYTLLLFVLLIAAVSYAQDDQDNDDYRITVGANFRWPRESLMTTFPLILGKKGDPKSAVGGFGVGVSRFTALNSIFDLKTTLNFSRQVYWNEPIGFNKGPNPQDMLGYVTPMTVEYYGEVSGVVHWVPREHFSVGLGVGFEVLLTSTLKLSSHDVRNREYKPVMPVVPLEISWKGDLMLYNIRIEGGLLNRYRNDLRQSGPNFFGLLCFEVGMRI